MPVDPYKATSYSVGRILNALTSDADGNLILADVPNGTGITLSEIIAGLLSSVTTNLNGSVFFKQIYAVDFSEVTYTFGDEPEATGQEYIIQHNFGLTHKESFTITIIEIETGRKIEPQEVVVIDGDSIRLIMPDITDIAITVVGFES